MREIGLLPQSIRALAGVGGGAPACPGPGQGVGVAWSAVAGSS